MERGDMRGERMDEVKGGLGDTRLEQVIKRSACAASAIAGHLSSPTGLTIWAAVLAACPAAPLTPLNMSAYSSRYSFMAAGLLCAVVLDAVGRFPLHGPQRLSSRASLVAVAGLVATAPIPLIPGAFLAAGGRVPYTVSSMFTRAMFFVAALSWGLLAIRACSAMGQDPSGKVGQYTPHGRGVSMLRRAALVLLGSLMLIGFARPVVLIIATSLGGIVVPDLPAMWRDAFQGGWQVQWATAYRVMPVEVVVAGYILPAVLNAASVVGIAALGYRAASSLSAWSYTGAQEDDARLQPGVLVVGSVALGMAAWALISQAWRPSPWNALPYCIAALLLNAALVMLAANAAKCLRAAEEELPASNLAKESPAAPRRDLPAAFDALTDRERRCLELALEGLPSADIAERLGIRPSTVRTYLQRAYKKGGFESLEGVKESLGGIEDPDAVQIGSMDKEGTPLSMPCISQRCRFMLVVGLILTVAGLSAPLPYGFPCWGEASTWALAIVFGSAPMVAASVLGPAFGLVVDDEIRSSARLACRVCLGACVALAVFSLGLLAFRLHGAWLHASEFGSPLSFAKFMLLSGMIASTLALFACAGVQNMARASALTCVFAMVVCSANAVPGIVLTISGVCVVLLACLEVGFTALKSMRQVGLAGDYATDEDPTKGSGRQRSAPYHAWSSTLALCAPALFAGIVFEQNMRSAFAGSGASDYLLAVACTSFTVVLAVAVWRRSRDFVVPILAALAFLSIDAIRAFQLSPSPDMAALGLMVAIACAFLASCHLGAARVNQMALPVLFMGLGALASFRLFNVLDDVSSNPFIAYQTPVAQWSFWLPQAYIDPAVWPVLAILVLFMAALGAAFIAMVIAFWRLWATAFDELEMGEVVESAAFDQARLRSYLIGRGLNDLQATVVLGVLKGWTSARIARESNYSVGAVNAARDVAYKRLRVHSKAQLAALVKRDVGF